MSELDKAAQKRAKKGAKLAQKVAKKQVPPPMAGSAAPASPAPHSGSDPDSPAERSARAAEQKVALERWRIWLALIGVVIALLTILVTLLMR